MDCMLGFFTSLSCILEDNLSSLYFTNYFFFFAEELGICLLFFYTCIQQNFKPLRDCFVDFVLPVPISLIIKCITQWFDDNDPEI
jgi:hypothetical protein